MKIGDDPFICISSCIIEMPKVFVRTTWMFNENILSLEIQ